MDIGFSGWVFSSPTNSYSPLDRKPESSGTGANLPKGFTSSREGMELEADDLQPASRRKDEPGRLSTRGDTFWDRWMPAFSKMELWRSVLKSESGYLGFWPR